MSFNEFYTQRVDEIDQYLNGFFIRSDNKFVETINKSMRYSYTASGKRLRPLLLIEFAKLFKEPCHCILDMAAAIEMIHTYSLIHDDLPAMDNDDLRRGKPTNHVVFGEDVAILAGDALLNYAYETMFDCALKDQENMIKYLEASRVIAGASGHRGMILGQVADIMNEGIEIDLETLDFINLHKTGDLLRAAMVGGAILGGATREEQISVEKIATKMGLCFQLIDDILDIQGDAKEMGKTPGSDEKNEKTTYPKLLGINQSKALAEELLNDSIQLLETFNADTEFIKALFHFIYERNK